VKQLIVIAGPTATGKSALAVYLARLYETEIISADSMQVYKGMDIGTAKPSAEEMGGIRHHMISIVEPDTGFSVGEYVRLSRTVIEMLHGRGRIPVVAGGTGLYIRGLVDGLCELPEADPRIRKRLFEDEDRHGKGYLYSRLSEDDPVSAGRIESNDVVKIVRALEVFEIAGVPISKIQASHGFKEKQYSPVMIGLTMERKTLYEKIEKRVDNMTEQGLEEEIRKLISRYGNSPPLMNGLGYKQFAGYFNGRYSREDAVSLLKRDTKRYAKRQFTWFNRDYRIKWFTVKEDLSHYEEIAEEVKRMLSVIRSENN
jgi:tRNA dimethylallyltransferase